MKLTITGVDEKEILDQFSEGDVIEAFGTAALLDEIGEEEARKHFGIEED